MANNSNRGPREPKGNSEGGRYRKAEGTKSRPYVPNHERKRRKEERDAERERKAKYQRELAILLFMQKTDVQYHHHGETSSLKREIQEAIDKLTASGRHEEYNSYIWNYQGEGNNYMPLSQLGKLFRGSQETPTIYDVPLDGSYVIYCYDSGQRGLGSFHYITAVKSTDERFVPKVDPGAFPPITY